MKHKERNIGKGKGDETQSQTGTQKEIHNIETKYYGHDRKGNAKQPKINHNLSRENIIKARNKEN